MSLELKLPDSPGKIQREVGTGGTHLESQPLEKLNKASGDCRSLLPGLQRKNVLQS